MGRYVARFRFTGAPPSREEVDRELRRQAGDGAELTGYRVDGQEAHVSAGIGAPMSFVIIEYVGKVMADLGGTHVDYTTGEPSDEPQEAFVSSPWHEHDEATRQAILQQFHDDHFARQ